jgi:glycosyltransferase involved in cell wall biosynthesis
VYVRYLSDALVRLGHDVEVLAGPPYPDLADGVSLTKVPSLDLYRDDDPFRMPRPHEFRGATDVLEYGMMCAASFPEPLTFTLRAARLLSARKDGFDVVHDNQSLGYGLLLLKRSGLPVVATVHHPISVDRAIDISHARGKRKLALRRWYSFCRMQARVARRVDRLIAVSESARADTLREFQVPTENLSVVSNGVDSELFRPLPEIERVPGRLITTASADVPLKGLLYLIEAVAKLRTERDVTLTVIGKKNGKSAARRAIERYGLHDAVDFRSGIGWLELVELYASAEIAVVPSLYEGFSLPAVEAMSCGVPLVATSGGAIPEVTGPDGDAALLVPPADSEALAARLRVLLDNEGMRRKLGAAGRVRAVAKFSWTATAHKTVAEYEKALAC